MPKDYAKKRSLRRKPAATVKKPATPPGSKIHPALYVSAGLALGLLIAFLVFLQQQPAKPLPNTARTSALPAPEQTRTPTERKKQKRKKSPLVTQQAVRKTPKRVDTKKRGNNKKLPQKPEIQYDFYTMLPDVEIEVPEPELNQGEQKLIQAANPNHANEKNPIQKKQPMISKKNTNHKHAKNYYQLQVAAFKNMNTAEELRARLGMNGVQSHIATRLSANKQRVYRVIIGPSTDDQKLRLIQARLKQMRLNPLLQRL